MFMRRALALGLVLLGVAACSSSSTDSGSGSNGGGGGGGGDGGGGGGGGGSTDNTPNCGKVNCDPAKQYCVLAAKTDSQGNTTWNPDHCNAIPSTCKLPPTDENTCSMDPMSCDPSSFCDCVDKLDPGCKNLTVQLTKCAESSSLIGIGCTSG